MSRLPNDDLLAAVAICREARTRLLRRLETNPDGPNAQSIQQAIAEIDKAITHLIVATGGPFARE